MTDVRALALAADSEHNRGRVVQACERAGLDVVLVPHERPERVLPAATTRPTGSRSGSRPGCTCADSRSASPPARRTGWLDCRAT